MCVLVALGVGMALGMAIQRTYFPCVELPVVRIERDTVTVIDTLRQDRPVPRIEYRTKTDTIRVRIDGQDGTGQVVDPDTPDTSDEGQQIDVELPITSKVYEQPNVYRAVVSGFRPSLDSIDVYQRDRIVRETVTKVERPRWVLSVGGGVGYTTERKVVPHVGATLGWAIWSK